MGIIQIFLLFVVLFLPGLMRLLQEPIGKFLYALVTLFCVLQALLLRRALAKLE